MKVLFVTHYNSLLGANLSMLQLILELREKGVKIEVLLPNNDSHGAHSLKSRLIQENIPFIEAKIRPLKHPSILKLLPNYLYQILLCRKILNLFDERKYDIVHSNTSITDIGKRIARHIGAAHVWHLREFGDLDYNMKTPFGKWYQKVIYSGNNNFIAISHSIRVHFSPYIGSQSISLIYNGIKLPSELENSFHKNGNIVQFCVVGVFHPNKGQFDAVKSINELVSHRNITNLHLSLIGASEGDYYQSIKAYVDANNLSNYVSFWGHNNNIVKILKSMDIGLTTSYNEAFGRVTIEYMMNRLAVIATDGGANREIIDDGVNGLIYPVKNFKILADKMEKLIKNERSRKTLAENGHIKAINCFSSTTNSSNVFGLYQKILEKSY